MQLQQLFGKDLGNVYSAAFDKIEKAERIISRYFPDRTLEPEGLFLALCPTFPDMPMRMFEVRCHQVCKRAKETGEVNLVPAADMLYVLHQLSLKAPLSAPYMFAMYELFAECFPAHESDVLDQHFEHGYYDYAGQREEIREELHRACLKSRQGQ